MSTDEANNGPLSSVSFTVSRNNAGELLEFVVGEQWIGDKKQTDVLVGWLMGLAMELLGLPGLVAKETALSLDLRLARVEAERLQGSIAHFEWAIREVPKDENQRAYLTYKTRVFQASLRAFLFMSGQL